MRRFSFTTTSSPKYSGEGVDWGSGKATYRLSVNSSAYYAPVTVAVADIAYQYGGLPGYTFTYADA